MNSKQKKTKDKIFYNPISANIKWDDVESLFKALGGSVTEAEGSRVCIEIQGKKAVFHRPHPKREISKAVVISVRRFLINVGIDHDEI